MLLYHVPERDILCAWSLETLIQKVKHGFDFILMQKGIVKEHKTEHISDQDLVALYQ
ncbi:hypothetical protein [Treponema lecithinolyticum]